ncbi:MAG: hypothetical protein KDA58_15840 [Planctomycetaceae bacterium]|nr:hypothetical protein [Planctomycetaceae bacterium]
MRHLFNYKPVLAAALVLGGMSLASANVEASDCHQPRCYWKTVTVIECVERPVVKYVTKYDHCGKPYLDKVIVMKTMHVPVQKRVWVCE